MHCRLSLPPAAPAPAPALHFRVFRPAFSRCSWVFANQTMLRFYCNGGLAHTFDLTPRRNPQQLVGALLSSGGPPLALSPGPTLRTQISQEARQRGIFRFTPDLRNCCESARIYNANRPPISPPFLLLPVMGTYSRYARSAQSDFGQFQRIRARDPEDRSAPQVLRFSWFSAVPGGCV
ncbi:hypothetical protein L209DRAFT_448317 [Thermothelomyces heterothallicus CBS 203.75]